MHDDDANWNPHGQRADVVQPLADVESDDVHQRRCAQRKQREDDVERGVVREMRPRVLAHEENVAGGEIEDGGEVREVAGPVSPGGHEAGEVSEGAFAPDVESAFAGIAGRKFENGKGERRVEAEPGANPDDNGTRTGGGGGGDPAQADAGNHVKQNQIAEAENTLWAVGIFGLGDGYAGGDERYSVYRVGVRVVFRQSVAPGPGCDRIQPFSILRQVFCDRYFAPQ